MSEYFRLIRVHQWHKNSFVLLGFFLRGDHQNMLLLSHSLLASLAFCFMSSAIYIINDLIDAESDRSHPIKKHRPLAAKTIKPNVAIIILFSFVGISVVLAWSLSLNVVLIIAAYLINNIVYTFFTKKLPIIDVFQVAFGFMLRIFAGTVGIGIYISEWMVITGFMLSLLIGFSKRFVELTHAQNPQSQRQVLKLYLHDTLKSYIFVMAAATIVTYALYTLSPRSISLHNTTNLIYTTPFVIFGILRFMFLTFAAQMDEDPANFLISDKQLLGTILIWIVVYGLIIT